MRPTMFATRRNFLQLGSITAVSFPVALLLSSCAPAGDYEAAANDGRRPVHEVLVGTIFSAPRPRPTG